MPGAARSDKFVIVKIPACAPGSHEYVLAESGTLQLTIGGDEVTLRPGDSVYFPADRGHWYANPGPVLRTYYVAALIMRPRGNRRYTGRRACRGTAPAP